MNKNKFDECDIVQDLLPLYYDDACTPASRELVQKHLQTCEKCRKTYEELKNTTVDTILKKESAGVLERHARKERNTAYKAGVVIAGLLLLPIMITFMVSMGNGGGLGSFAVLTASMLLIAAFTVVPLVSKSRRTAKSILAGIAALLLILFFVDRLNGGGEFVLWSIPTIFGLSLILFPLVIRGIGLPTVLADKKALLTMAWDTLWLFLTIFEVCSYSGDMEGMRAGFIIAGIFMTEAWIIFLVIRYLPVNVWLRSGIAVLTGAVCLAFANDAYLYLAEHKKQLTILWADFSNWSDTICINANVYLLILLLGGGAGILLLVYGLLKAKRSRRAR